MDRREAERTQAALVAEGWGQPVEVRQWEVQGRISYDVVCHDAATGRPMTFQHPETRRSLREARRNQAADVAEVMAYFDMMARKSGARPPSPKI